MGQDHKVTLRVSLRASQRRAKYLQWRVRINRTYPSLLRLSDTTDSSMAGHNDSSTRIYIKYESFDWSGER